MDHIFGLFGDQQQPWSPPSAESGPFLSTVAAAVLSNPNPLDSRMYYYRAGRASAASPDYYLQGQIPDEYTFSADMDLVNDDSLWPDLGPDLPLLGLENSLESDLIPETHHPIDNSTGSEALLNVFDPESNFWANINNFVPPETNRSTTSVRYRWPNFVWLVRACHRLSHAAAANLKVVPEARIIDKAFKGVMTKKGKFVCETRVMKRIQLEKNKMIKKVWLGTYQTQAQAARALDVGKYFFNAKETKTFSDPRIETMLSTLSHQLLPQPLEVLVDHVKKLAEHYGNHGTLPPLNHPTDRSIISMPEC